ncbi:MAG: class I SAM-dependent methyltransferase [Candidatus Omnitrophica bacterium]|nr:class I SAM-dependent methyltransferase [Candidatus Omnitrophota bacterium]MCB9747907.1 class I SAM-dependent methyltransferase [Candidatus Omnitrophota bacterium]
MELNPKKDYGFTCIGARDTKDLPVWDQFRLNKIREIFQTCSNILDFANDSRGLTQLLSEDLKGKTKRSIDINDYDRPDILADICNLNMIDDQSIDGIVCSGVLQCVYNPFKAVEELHRILKPGGKLFVYLSWIYRYSGATDGTFHDYYRFSKDGARYLFRNFNNIEISPIRGRKAAILNLTKTFRKRGAFQKIFRNIINKFDDYSELNPSGFNVFLIK